MPERHAALFNFIRQELIGADHGPAPVKPRRSMIPRTVLLFRERGWEVEDLRGPGERVTRNRLTSPDGTLVLGMVGGMVYRHPDTTARICKRKHLTKRMLTYAGVAVPEGGEFSPQDREVAEVFFEMMPKPIVVKPTDAGGSQGVTVGVVDLPGLRAAWDHALAGRRANSNVLMEEFVPGVELRAFVVGDRCVHVVARVLAHVVGAGGRTVAELIEQENAARRADTSSAAAAIDPDWGFMQAQGIGPDTVPRAGEIVIANPFALRGRGASIVDVTERVHPDILDLSVRAKQAIPHLEVGGIDLLVGDVRDPATARVIEVNTAASTELHRFPTHGPGRLLEEDIVDYFHGRYLAGRG